MDIDPREPRSGLRIDIDAGFFHRFAGGRGLRSRIVRFHMSTGQKPPIQTAVVHEQHLRLARMHHESCAGEVAGRELVAGKRCIGVAQQIERQRAAFRRQPIRAGIERLDNRTAIA